MADVGLRALRDALRGIVYWVVGIVLLDALTVSIYPSVRDSPQFADLTEQYPEEIQAFLGGEIDFTTGPGYLEAELFSLMVPLMLLVYTISAGSRAIAGEEQAGTLDLLLANPVRRGAVVAGKLGALVVQSGILALAIFASIAAVGAAVDLDVTLQGLAAATVAAWLLALLHGALALLVGAATGSRAAAIAVPSAVAVVAYLLDGLGSIVGFLEPFRVLSVFHWYTAPDPLRGDYGPGWIALLLAFGVALGLAALPAFARRDVGVKR
jgi:ABC-2 type transport system permease protein